MPHGMIRRKVEMEKPVECGEILRLIDNGKCYTIVRESEIVGFISYTDQLKGVYLNPYRVVVRAHYGNRFGFDDRHAVIDILYKALGG